MKRYGWLAIGLCLLMFFSGCGYKSQKQGAMIDEANVDKVVVDGQTTRQEVVLEFGPPTKTMEDEKMFFYTWTETSKSNVPLYSGKTTVTRELIILFDDDGVVKNHKIVKTARESKSGFGGQKVK